MRHDGKEASFPPSIPPPQYTTENNGENEGISEKQSTLKDINVHMRWTYELVSIGVKEINIAVTNVNYLLNEMGYHESIINDNDRELRELMGIVDIIKKEVKKLANMNYCSHCQENPTQDHPMEETSVVQPVHGSGDKKMQ